MPLYNNENTLERAIESALSQSISDFIIILSDDGSTDNTWDICQRYSKKYKNILAYKQKSNLYYNNFKFTLHKAKTPYFVWLAGDDFWENNYLERCLDILEHHTDVVCCVSRCIFFSKGEKNNYATGTFSLVGSIYDNLVNYINNPSDNTRMYGVFRTDCLVKSFPDEIMHAYDWAISARSLLYGKHVEIDEVLLKRDLSPIDSYSKLAFKDNSNIILKIFPILKLTCFLLSNEKQMRKFRIIRKFIKLNINVHMLTLKYQYQKIFSVLSPFYNFYNRYISWRL